MTNAQAVWAHLCITALVVGHVATLIDGHEHWPFSPFPMYSETRTTWNREAFTLYGVPVETPDTEVRLDQAAILSPWDPSNLSDAFASLLGSADGQARVEQALAGFLRSYEERRQQGGHSGPALAALRLYRTMTALDPRLTHASPPHRTRLVAAALAGAAAAGR